jgi:cell division septation protein DedD
MRGTVAEQRSGAGYSLRSSGNGDRADSSGRRMSSSGWEIRLGKLQLTVWLGLALGAMVGGYFVGFFSGRYVGFESARESTAGEVPKLPAPDLFANNAALSPNGVYDRLKAPAILRESNGPRASAKIIEPQAAREAAAPTQKITITDLTAQANNQADNTAIGADASNSKGSDGDEIFDESASGGELIIGSDDGVIDGRDTAGVPPSVRMLGGSSEKAAPTNDDAAAMALLDARIANARSEASKLQAAESAEVPGLAKVQDDKVPGKAEVEKSVNTAASKLADKPVQKEDGKSLVRKVLPSGYFAQVAAPKNLSEAEAVAKKLKRSGFPVVVESANVSGQSFYRVLVGPEENKVQADRLVSQLQGESYVASKPFIKKVK